MIKLKDLIETDFPQNPFKSSKYDWTDDDDMNMNDEEWEEFQTELQFWTDDMRKRKLTNKMVDVDELITDWLLILQKKREQGDVCGLYKRIGIKYLGDRGKLKYGWEKDYYDKHFRLQS
mgnify:CR=1 FL=1